MDQIFYSSVTTYRVVVSHNPKNPEVYYVDMCKDGFCSHDLLFEMQKKFYRNGNLERVFNDSRGIMLKEYKDGSIHLFYVKHRDPMAQERQNKIRQKVDPEIIRVFKQMKAAGKLQTISVQTHEFYYDTQRQYIDKPAWSLFEEKAREALAREEKAKKLREIKQAYYAKQKFASCPQVLLKLNQQWQAE